MAERTNTESARDVFDKEQPRTSRTFFREMSEELVSRSYELIPYKPDTRHVVSTLRVSTVVHRDACRFSSPRSVRAKNRNKTCKFNCIASTRFPNERRPHRRTRANHFSEILNYKVGDNYPFQLLNFVTKYDFVTGII